MALSDPLSLTYNSHPAQLARTGMTANSSSYAGSTTDGAFSVTTSQNPQGSKVRRAIRYAWDRPTADPIVPSNNIVTANAVTVLFETPTTGSNLLVDIAFAKSVLDAIRAGSDLVLTQLMSGQV